MGVDFAANASSKAIKESVDLSAAITASGVASAGTSIAADGNSVTFNYNGTYTEVKKDQTGMTGGRWRHEGNNVGMDGSVQSVTLAPGVYLLEAWGAQGGVAYHGTAGGKGGYVKGYYTVTGSSPVTIYVAVGGKGSDNYVNNTAPATETNRSLAFVGNDWKNLSKGGGWNGGGGIIATDSAGGGGATHFALSNHGQLKNYKTYSSMLADTNRYEPTGVTADYSGDVLMVAGGGGGAPWEAPTEHKQDGAGGGTTGGEAAYWAGAEGWASGNTCHGTGGTQTTGGIHKVRGTTSHLHIGGSTSTATTTWKTHPTNGFFGQGGIGIGHDHAGGGGGGGWYGGGGGFVLGGGGGSSYTKANVITDPGHTQGNREGHGMAKITFIRNVATQTAVPTLTLNRHEDKTFAFKGTSNANSLLGTHPNNLAVSADVTNVYQVDGLTDAISQATLLGYNFTDAQKANAAANSWLAYSFTTTGVTLKATRYWTGTKQFYVKVKIPTAH